MCCPGQSTFSTFPACSSGSGSSTHARRHVTGEIRPFLAIAGIALQSSSSCMTGVGDSIRGSRVLSHLVEALEADPVLLIQWRVLHVHDCLAILRIPRKPGRVPRHNWNAQEGRFGIRRSGSGGQKCRECELRGCPSQRKTNKRQETAHCSATVTVV